MQTKVVEGSGVGNDALTFQMHSCKYESILDVATRVSPQEGCLATKILSGMGVVYGSWYYPKSISKQSVTVHVVNYMGED